MGFDWIFEDDGFSDLDEFEGAEDSKGDEASDGGFRENGRSKHNHHRHGRNRHAGHDSAAHGVSASESDAPAADSFDDGGSESNGGDGDPKIAELLSKVKELEDKCESLENEKTEAFNKMLLVKADSENYKKRLDKDREDAVRLANKGIVVDLLPSLDSIDVALSAISDEGIRQGIEMVRNSFLTALGKWGLQLLSPLDKEFDPMECEACLFEEREGIDKETVIEVLQAGYVLHGKVVRPAKVKIAKPAG